MESGVIVVSSTCLSASSTADSSSAWRSATVGLSKLLQQSLDHPSPDLLFASKFPHLSSSSSVFSSPSSPSSSLPSSASLSSSFSPPSSTPTPNALNTLNTHSAHSTPQLLALRPLVLLNAVEAMKSRRQSIAIKTGLLSALACYLRMLDARRRRLTDLEKQAISDPRIVIHFHLAPSLTCAALELVVAPAPSLRASAPPSATALSLTHAQARRREPLNQNEAKDTGRQGLAEDRGNGQITNGEEQDRGCKRLKTEL